MDIKDFIVIAGIIAIVVIIWDGLRRMKANKPAKAKLKTKAKTKAEFEKTEPYLDPEEEKRKAELARELPNGGARVREMTESEKSALKTRINLRERVPMLMERVDVERRDDETQDAEDNPDLQSEMDFSAALAEPKSDEAAFESGVDRLEDSEVDSSESDEIVEVEVNPVVETDEASSTELTDEQADELEFEIEPKPDVEIEINAETGLIDSEHSEVKVADPAAAPKEAEITEEERNPGPVEDLVIIHVMAKKGEELSGSKVLDLLLTAGLRLGSMDIFHYRNPKGITEFSLANCVQPGTFDPDSMNQVNTPGVTLFMQLPTAANSLEAFEHMHEMAKFLAHHLEAEVLDEEHSTVTKQRIEYYREKLRSFERSRLIPS